MDGVVDDIGDGRVVLLLVLDQLRPVAAAENVVLPSVPLVEGARVDPVEVAHSLVEVGQRGFDEKVVVVPHQTAHVDPPAVAAYDAAENLDEDDAVSGVADDRRLVVAAGRDVVTGAGEDDTVRSSHTATVAAAVAVVPSRESFGTGPARPRHVPGTSPVSRERVRWG
jgi:hypothetical protein